MRLISLASHARAQLERQVTVVGVLTEAQLLPGWQAQAKHGGRRARV